MSALDWIVGHPVGVSDSLLEPGKNFGGTGYRKSLLQSNQALSPLLPPGKYFKTFKDRAKLSADPSEVKENRSLIGE